MDTRVELSSRLPGVGVSVFAVMTRLANEHAAINLSQGFPDFHCAPDLIALVREWLGRGQNQYAPMAGVPALRQALVRKIETHYGARYDPDTEITITAGATEAIFAAITALVHPGDEELVFEPCYDSYVPANSSPAACRSSSRCGFPTTRSSISAESGLPLALISPATSSQGILPESQ